MDRRETNQQWYDSFDERNMTLTLKEGDGRLEIDEDGEEVFIGEMIPAIFEVCGTCDGKGKHVNPSIDSNGLSAEDFDEDPDFRENYFSGMYDVPCNECHGKRVVPAPDYNRMTEEQKKNVEEAIESHHAGQYEEYMERKMGY